jgi:hypothetical protein
MRDELSRLTAGEDNRPNLPGPLSLTRTWHRKQKKRPTGRRRER